MNLNYSEEQIMLREQIQKFCESEYDFYKREDIVKSSEDFDSNVWKLTYALMYDIDPSIEPDLHLTLVILYCIYNSTHIKLR